MRPAEKLIKKFDIDVNAGKDRQILDEILRAQANSKTVSNAARGLNIWRTIGLASAAVVVLLVCRFAIRNKSEPEQYEVSGPTVATISKTPAELASVISLNVAFRDGDMEAVERQFEMAEKKVKSGLKEQITIDQLICELEESEKTQKGQIL